MVPTTEVPLGSLSDPPNAITASRLAVTVLCFTFLQLGWHSAALVAFAVAAGTDWADGYWARRWGPITKLGRVLDPLADKLLVCGVFTYLAAIPESRVAPWMAVVVLARELLVTTLRALVEGAGGDFSAVGMGKMKFVWQVWALMICLAYLTPLRTSVGVTVKPFFVDIWLWNMLVWTVVSGITYTRSALRAMRGQTSPGG